LKLNYEFLKLTYKQMAATKTDRMEEEIDSCRCHGQWQKLPKLAKKISKYPNYAG